MVGSASTTDDASAVFAVDVLDSQCNLPEQRARAKSGSDIFVDMASTGNVKCAPEYAQAVLSRSADVARNTARPTSHEGHLRRERRGSFTLAYQLKLTPEEHELVRQYKLENYPVTRHTIQGTRPQDETIGSMVRGE